MGPRESVIIVHRHLQPVLGSRAAEFSIDVFWFQSQREVPGDGKTTMLSVVGFHGMQLMPRKQQQIPLLRNNRPGISIPLIERRDAGFVILLPVVMKC